MRCKHQELSFQNRIITEWKVYSHLVTVEVGIERRTCERVQLNCLAFNPTWAETPGIPNRWSVGARLSKTDDHVPHFQECPTPQALCGRLLSGTLHRLYHTTLNELTDDKGLVQLSVPYPEEVRTVHLQLRPTTITERAE